MMNDDWQSENIFIKQELHEVENGRNVMEELKRAVRNTIARVMTFNPAGEKVKVNQSLLCEVVTEVMTIMSERFGPMWYNLAAAQYATHVQNVDNGTCEDMHQVSQQQDNECQQPQAFNPQPEPHQEPHQQRHQELHQEPQQQPSHSQPENLIQQQLSFDQNLMNALYTQAFFQAQLLLNNLAQTPLPMNATNAEQFVPKLESFNMSEPQRNIFNPCDPMMDLTPLPMPPELSSLPMSSLPPDLWPYKNHCKLSVPTASQQPIFLVYLTDNVVWFQNHLYNVTKHCF
ncbi:hypothetical protein DICVIV_13801 [Dictyocaulus viviparus]|uniref:Uncharacterized protein n=1 Tax=Dictyocaulus viviparus TaxID=29172 RepID=A0A0D8X940_DICVI|nr:hypothetical protein DICVIV_13801 [Dictyocaulus viviparus]